MGLHLFFSKYNILPLPLFLSPRKHAYVLRGRGKKTKKTKNHNSHDSKPSDLSVHSTSLQCSCTQLNVQEVLGAALIFGYDNTKAKVLHAIYLFPPRDINLLYNATVAEQHHLRKWEERKSCVQLLSPEFRRYIKRATECSAGPKVLPLTVSAWLSPTPWTSVNPQLIEASLAEHHLTVCGSTCPPL